MWLRVLVTLAYMKGRTDVRTENDVMAILPKCLPSMGYQYFLSSAVRNYAEKTELSKFSWYPKIKLGVTMHFSEIIKLQFGKERHTLLCILKLFTNIVD